MIILLEKPIDEFRLLLESLRQVDIERFFEERIRMPELDKFCGREEVSQHEHELLREGHLKSKFELGSKMPPCATNR